MAKTEENVLAKADKEKKRYTVILLSPHSHKTAQK